MTSRPPRAPRRPLESLLLLAAGVTAGLLVGVLLADRVGGLEGVRRRLGDRRRRPHRDDGWRGDEGRSQPFENLPDDDSELAPEAIAHLHLAHTAVRDAAPPPPVVSPVGAELERRVLETFRNDPVLADRAIDISAVTDDAVVLTGWVVDAGEIVHAHTLARGVPGVRRVDAELRVGPAVRA